MIFKPADVGDNMLYVMTKSWPVTAPGSQGVFRGRGRGLRYGRQATFLSWFRLVQLPGQALRFYSSRNKSSLKLKLKIGLFGSMQLLAQNSCVALALVHTSVITVRL
jgi:hypothetical protein